MKFFYQKSLWEICIFPRKINLFFAGILSKSVISVDDRGAFLCFKINIAATLKDTINIR
jgi:hypothetical protein